MHPILLSFIVVAFFSLTVGSSFSQINPEALRDKAYHDKGFELKDKEPGAQPQNNPSNLQTKPGQAPASSPQGETPGGMQSAPKGSQGSNTENKK